MHILANNFRTKTHDHRFSILRDVNVDFGSARNIWDLPESPEVIEAPFAKILQYPIAGDFKTLRSPIGFSCGSDCRGTPPRLLGERTESVLADVYRLDENRLASLRAEKVIA